MPHLRFRAIEPSSVEILSGSLIDPLQPLMDCPAEDFTFEYVPTTFFFAGKEDKAYPFVEVLWFDRGQDVQDKVAAIVTEQIRSLAGFDVQDIAVVFTALTPSRYYDNGSHY